MSAKFIYTLSDENPDLRKQIGCMNGIFQLFDRHHFLGGGSRRGSLKGQNHKKLPSSSSGQNGKGETETTRASQKSTDKNQKKTVKEKQRNSTESSRTSFSSSSCSSSLTSSMECSRTSQLELSSKGPSTVPDTHAWESSKYQPHASPLSQQSPDLRNVVKASIYRDTRGLSIKTATKGEACGQTLKYIDSPRPLLSPKSVNSKGSGFKESFQVLHKLKDTPQKCGERKYDGLCSAVKDSPRFSCDGRESRAALKSTIKLKELPRLSLDSRAGSTRGSAIEIKSNSPLRDSEVRNANSNNFLNQQEEPGSYRRPSSVVARLMGLEALPDSMSNTSNQTGQIETHLDGEINGYARFSRAGDETTLKQFSASPRNQLKEPVSHRPTNVYATRKLTASSKFPMEPAPWRQLDGNKICRAPALKSCSTATKPPNSSLSVYGEIEKQLAQLEFKKSGKDLRALKQILQAMHKTKEVLDTRNVASYSTQTSSSNNSLDQGTKFANLQNPTNNYPISVPDKGNGRPTSFKSPIVIMKPVKLIGKEDNSASLTNPTETSRGLHRLQTGADSRKESVDKKTTKDITPRSNHGAHSAQPLHSTSKNGSPRTIRLAQTPKELKSTRECHNPCKSVGTTNQRQQQKNLVLEKRPNLTNQSSDSNKTRRQPSGQLKDLCSSSGKPRVKTPKLQPSDDELSDISTETKDLNLQADAISLQSESNVSLASMGEEEVSSTDKSNKINDPFIHRAHRKQKNPVERSSKEKSIPEQPSPVSVLDATFYSDDLPSPIKKRTITFKDDDAITSDEIMWNPANANLSCHTNSCLNSQTGHKKEEIIHFLMQNVMQFLSAKEGTIDHESTHLYNSLNPDHRYISEILLMSGILRDFETGIPTTRLPRTGQSINPNVFLALEQAKASNKHSVDVCKGIGAQSDSEPHVKTQRRLIFDLVNEILYDKLLLETSCKQGLSLGKRPQGQQLLEELCSEVDRLQGNNSNCSLDDGDDSLKGILWEDLTHESSNWTACHCEVPCLVLDVERLIFKDLINEVVAAEVNAVTRQSFGHCRKLFSK